MDKMNEYTPDLYELEDEEGNKQTFELLDCMEYEGEQYYALTPYYEEEDAEAMLEDSGEVVILRVEYDMETGEEILASIEDEDLYETIGQIFMDRIEEMFGFDEEDEEGYPDE
ncbi:MAG: DUF1292 domain-containing protein [Ruminococcus sp.]|nr:DUF1292 domain-containing protein [Ruminococcus sp.]